MIRDVERMVSGLPEVQRQMLAVTGEAWSPDRMVRARVGPRGHLLELDIDPRVYRRPDSTALSATIVSTVRMAVEDVTRQVREIYEQGLPKDMRPGTAGEQELGYLLYRHDADLPREGGGSS